MCQENPQEKLFSTPNEYKRIRDVSEIRNDSVSKRLKLLSSSTQFKYHVSNRCSKAYTHTNQLDKLKAETHDITSKIGSKRGALKAESMAHLERFG